MSRIKKGDEEERVVEVPREPIFDPVETPPKEPSPQEAPVEVPDKEKVPA